MINLSLTNLSFLKNYLSSQGLMPRKRYGQNFVIDERLVDTLLDAADVTMSDLIVEIGPGIGTLTEHLLKTGADVISVEIDKRLAELITHHFQDKLNFTLLQGDFIRSTTQSALIEHTAGHENAIKIVANVPYYITTPIITTVLQSSVPYECIVMTIQHEVAERLAAEPGSKTYGAITVFTRFYADCEIIDTFAPQSFFPSPKVHSSIIRITPYKQSPYQCEYPLFFHGVVKQCFNERRKMIKNNVMKTLRAYHCDQEYLNADFVTMLLNDVDIRPQSRPEELSVGQFLALTKAIWKYCPANIQKKYTKGG